MQTTAVASLTDHFHRFLEAVKEACGLQTGQGLFAGPMALLLWIRTRRMRKEAAAAMAEALRALMQEFTVLLEQFREGKLLPPVTPEVGEARQAAEAKPRDGKAGRTGLSPLRSAEREGSAKREGEVYSPRRSVPQGGEPARDPGLRPRSAAQSRLRSTPVCAPPWPAPPSGEGVLPLTIAPRARPPPRRLIFVGNSVRCV
jgi:hypothetical protein